MNSRNRALEKWQRLRSGGRIIKYGTNATNWFGTSLISSLRLFLIIKIFPGLTDVFVCDNDKA